MKSFLVTFMIFGLQAHAANDFDCSSLSLQNVERMAYQASPLKRTEMKTTCNAQAYLLETLLVKETKLKDRTLLQSRITQARTNALKFGS